MNLSHAGTVDVPAHVGIIMDGNGRWAAKRSLPRKLGHKQGAKVFGDIATHCEKIGVRHLTVYAFSTENWRRPQEEIDAIMDLMREYLRDIDRHAGKNIRTTVIGDRTPLPVDIRADIAAMERKTRDRTGMTLNIALNYGSRSEILRAVRNIARDFRAGKLDSLSDVDEGFFSEYLYTAEQPEVDLIIRTGGERRVSNFLLWQGAYAEYVFSDVMWPDFTPRHLDDAVAEFARRTRRMGGT